MFEISNLLCLIRSSYEKLFNYSNYIIPLNINDSEGISVYIYPFK